MNTGIGRAARVILGLALIALGTPLSTGHRGRVLAVVGLVPLAMGIWGRCLLELDRAEAHLPPRLARPRPGALLAVSVPATLGRDNLRRHARQ